MIHGWWPGCPQLELRGYDPFSPAGANVNLIMENETIDPITVAALHRVVVKVRQHRGGF
ncbi:MAG TPA: hypothetical protein VJ646_12810 [Candidatus Binatia bacterium]|nr:hypothetical protein [Candidatus Binatia bacterium]